MNHGDMTKKLLRVRIAQGVQLLAKLRYMKYNIVYGVRKYLLQYIDAYINTLTAEVFPSSWPVTFTTRQKIEAV